MITFGNWEFGYNYEVAAVARALTVVEIAKNRADVLHAQLAAAMGAQKKR